MHFVFQCFIHYYLSSFLPPQPNHSRRNQFLDLHPYLRILHVFLQGSRIALRLLQDTLHHRVLKDGHDLFVG